LWNKFLFLYCTAHHYCSNNTSTKYKNTRSKKKRDIIYSNKKNASTVQHTVVSIRKKGNKPEQSRFKKKEANDKELKNITPHNAGAIPS